MLLMLPMGNNDSDYIQMYRTIYVDCLLSKAETFFNYVSHSSVFAVLLLTGWMHASLIYILSMHYLQDRQRDDIVFYYS